MISEQAKIFGIGLNRTATTSLHSALTELGFRSVHHPEDRITAEEVMRCIQSGGSELRLALLNQFDALLDAPIAATYKALDRAYPGSRFILTVRDVDDWLDSCERWWPLTRLQSEAPVLADSVRAFLQGVYVCLYGSVTFDRRLYAQAYERHVNDVLEHFRGRPDDLLILNVFEGEGWHELCGFLEVPQPETEFPFVNRLVDHPIYLLPACETALAGVVHPAESAAVADAGLGVTLPPDRKMLPLPDLTLGLPADGQGAIAQVQRIEAEGVHWIIFCSPAFWWLEEYAGLHDYLEDRSCAVERREQLVAFRLK